MPEKWLIYWNNNTSCSLNWWNTPNVCAKGNLLIYSLGNLSGWVIINFIELQSEKSTFPSGPLKLEEVSLVASISSIGGFLGNFVALPIIHRFGIKGSIHLCSVPIIVSHIFDAHGAQNNAVFYISVELPTHCFCTKCVLFVLFPHVMRIDGWCVGGWTAIIRHVHFRRQVR